MCVTAKNCESAERILKHLLFLVKVDELYKVALGMYDLQLTLLVAEKSQKVSDCSWTV